MNSQKNAYCTVRYQLSRTLHRVISEIDTGLRNLRTCNQWVSLMTSAESSELA